MFRHLAGISEVVDDVDAAVAFYQGLGLDVRRLGPDYAVVSLPGVLHFALVARPLMAEAVHGSRDAADRIDTGFVIGLEVDSADGAADVLGDAVIKRATAEYDQVTTRFLSPSGTPCEAVETPGKRRLSTAPTAED